MKGVEVFWWGVLSLIDSTFSHSDDCFVLGPPHSTSTKLSACIFCLINSATVSSCYCLLTFLYEQLMKLS